MPLSILPATEFDAASAVTEAEYKRLLSLPKSRVLQGDLLDRANRSREWYVAHGHPFAASIRIEIATISNTELLLAEGSCFHSHALIERLRDGEAHALIALAVTAGREVAKEIATHWEQGRPDEAFFLDRFATAVTEQLIQWSSAFLCRQMEASQETVLPHLSPGCGHWDLAEQHPLLKLFGSNSRIGPIQVLPSAALDPQFSALAAMGVTHRKRSANTTEICTICDFHPCAFRRAPYAS